MVLSYIQGTREERPQTPYCIGIKEMADLVVTRNNQNIDENRASCKVELSNFTPKWMR